MIKCKSFNRYKGICFPKCNNGNPCDSCLEKYYEAHRDTRTGGSVIRQDDTF